jgi:hypothetical protein
MHPAVPHAGKAAGVCYGTMMAGFQQAGDAGYAEGPMMKDHKGHKITVQASQWRGGCAGAQSGKTTLRPAWRCLCLQLSAPAYLPAHPPPLPSLPPSCRPPAAHLPPTCAGLQPPQDR